MTDGYRDSSAHGRNRKLSAWADDGLLVEFAADDGPDDDADD